MLFNLLKRTVEFSVLVTLVLLLTALFAFSCIDLFVRFGDGPLVVFDLFSLLGNLILQLRDLEVERIQFVRHLFVRL